MFVFVRRSSSGGWYTLDPFWESHSMLTRVGKTWLSCHDLAMITSWSWLNMVMIMPRWLHDGHISWHDRHDSWHNHGMITMFSMIHTMIVVWTSYFPNFCLKQYGLFVNVFSNSCCHIQLYGTLDWLRGTYASNLASQLNKTQITPQRLRAIFGNRQTGSSC